MLQDAAAAAAKVGRQISPVVMLSDKQPSSCKRCRSICTWLSGSVETDQQGLAQNPCKTDQRTRPKPAAVTSAQLQQHKNTNTCGSKSAAIVRRYNTARQLCDHVCLAVPTSTTDTQANTNRSQSYCSTNACDFQQYSASSPEDTMLGQCRAKNAHDKACTAISTSSVSHQASCLIEC
jgi:hypothetical protein